MKSLGPANDKPLCVTQELVAMYYAESPTILGRLVHEDAFFAGLTGKPPVEPIEVWETGALAAHLIEIGGQR